MSDGFQHITVTPEPEEDTVIFAGLGSARDWSAATEYQGEAADGRALEGRGSARADAVDIAEFADVGEADIDAATDVADVDSAEADAVSYAEEDLTLEDLESPMPLKQRIVIIAMVICLIGAIAYCLAFMR